jgi:hypothetical protein
MDARERPPIPLALAAMVLPLVAIFAAFAEVEMPIIGGSICLVIGASAASLVFHRHTRSVRNRTGAWVRNVAVAMSPVLYAAGFGPACWLASRYDGLQGPVSCIYWPAARAAWEWPRGRVALDALLWYGTLGESGSNPATRNVLNNAAPP